MQETRKKRIFVGSSSETKALADRIKEKMAPICDCEVWGEKFFEVGGYVYLDLVKKAIGFDYAIFIGGADDKVIRLSKNTEKISPRDNVYLEYGMYSSILSTNKSLFLVHEDCLVASDLAGMTLKTYREDTDALIICEKWILDSIEGKHEFSKNVELLPTVGIAVGYYYNFLKPVLDELSSTRKFTFDDKVYAIKEKKLIVNVPAYLESGVEAITEYKRALISQHDLEDAFLGRYRVLVDPNGLESGVLRLYDMPSTLLAVLKTIDFVFGLSEDELGPQDAQFAKFRAFDNFIDTLIDMIRGKSRLAAYVEFRRFRFFDS